MPPKKSGPSVKSIEKQKQKVIEDKTFGLKNKNKSKKVQKEIQHITQRVQQSGPRWTKEELEERERKKLEKLAAKEREKELKDLFKVVPSASSAVNQNENENGEDEEDDENEDEQEPTELDMLDALESLAEVERELDEEEEMTLEEVIEKERSKIVNGTPVTAETFAKWKQFKLEQKAKEEERLRKISIAAYKQSGTGLSGKALFEVDQSLFVDDVEATEEVLKVEDAEPTAEIDEDLFLDDEEEAQEETTTEASNKQYPKGVIVEDGELIYDADAWEDKAHPPKGLLFDWFTKRKITQLPKFEPVPMLEKGEGSLLKVVLTHVNPPKEFIPSKISANKKVAENVASLQAYYYLLEQEEQQQQQ